MNKFPLNFSVSSSPGDKQYDYIIAGAGCAGLSLLMRMIASGSFTDKQILLIDKVRGIRNDRTWCFWEQENGFFEPVVYKKWSNLWFHSNDFSKEFNIAPYQYKMIRGIDFYDYCFSIIQKQSNISIQHGDVKKIESVTGGALLWLNGEEIKARYIFNSIVFQRPILKKKEYYLLQHFKGWVIETSQETFDAKVATLMDFRVDQQYGTAFVYVMPFSPKKALVEYTFFTKEVLHEDIYYDGLKNYLHKFLKIEEYKITDEEFGIIPMTNHLFTPVEGNIINIGTAGGQTKPSSGYTFQFIQKRTAAIVQKMIATDKPFLQRVTTRRFHFYDTVLLQLLANRSLGGDIIFSELFRKNKVQSIFKFLDNETSLREDFFIIKSLPSLPFSRAAMIQLFG
jgi:lycopene beta-cyclase